MPQRAKNIFSPTADEPFALSRSKIDLFLECPRCFYFDRRLGVARPAGFPFNLNLAVDTLLKKEFDIHRIQESKHPLMKAYGIDAVPFQHEKLAEWRNNFKGIRFHHKKTNLVLFGAIDDIWVNQAEDLHIVDYKATSKRGEVSLDADWQISYKRQAEVYQWLFRRNNFTVSDTAYFVYCNGDSDKEAFDAKLEFSIRIIPYEGNDAWVETTLEAIKKCLSSDTIPSPAAACEYCAYRTKARQHER